MSGSPKYSRARLRAAQERLLRQARAQRAAQERARRAAEEERRKAERLAQARRDTRAEVGALHQRVSDLAAGEPGRWVRPELHVLQQRLRELDTALAGADSVKEVQRRARAMRPLQDDLDQLLAQAHATARAAGLAEVEAVRMTLQQRLAALDRTRSERFDPGALTEMEQGLQEAGIALDRQASAKARHLLSLVQTRLDRHLNDVRVRFDQWNEERDQCRAALAEAADRVAGLCNDEVILRWAAGDVQALENQLDQGRVRLEAGQFALVRAAANTIRHQVDQVVERVQEKQLHEDRRHYIVQGIIQVMNQLGFVVQAGSPALEDPTTPASATIIHARRVGGGPIAVSVPQQGDIWYDVAGFPLRTSIGSQGQPVPTCDEAEEQIEQMHAVLEQTFGIEMSELQWQGKDPNRIRKQADNLPGSRGASQRQGGRN